jgi:glyoxylase-like metal-dependent hydrolase (beta-lactamase superfamily II)
MKIIDLQFQGRARVIAAAVLEGPSGIALVDPGPASTLHALESGLQTHDRSLDDIRAILLTHIHLDHAGASGTLAARLPGVPVYVHEVGAPHMADPTRLLDSATRLYGDKMDLLWGEMRPVPADRLRVLKGGERLELAGRTLEVAYTPGHAAHHVSYFDHRSGLAYVGDTAGIRRVRDFVLAPTPPPDIDLEAWETSLQTIERWRPSTLFLTHFGPVSDVTDHLRRLRQVLDSSARRVKATLLGEGTDDERIQRFVDDMRAEIRRDLPEEETLSFEMAVPFAQLWQGLARYWRRRGAGRS